MLGSMMANEVGKQSTIIPLDLDFQKVRWKMSNIYISNSVVLSTENVPPSIGGIHPVIDADSTFITSNPDRLEMVLQIVPGRIS